MNRLILKTLAFVSLLSLLAISTLSAKSHSPRIAPKTQQAHNTVITAVTPSSLTIQEDTVTKSFAITPFTEVTVNGQRGSIADLKPGMSVNVTLGSDASKLSRIDAGPAPVSSAPAPRR